MNQNEIAKVLLLREEDEDTARKSPYLELWLDAADASTIASTGGLVDTWFDKSGKGNNATGVTTERPTTNSVTHNRLNVLDFDGGDNLTLPSSIYSLANGDNAIFAVAKTDNDSALQVVLGLAEGGVTRYDLRFNAAAGSINFQSKTTQTGGVTKTGVTDTTMGILRGRRRGTAQAIAYNGSLETVNANGADEAGIDAASIGSFNDGGGFFLNGQIAEIIVFSRALTLREVSRIEKYLKNKWGV